MNATTIITILYASIGFVSFAGYLPQLKQLISGKKDFRGIALHSWLIWVFTGGVSLSYGIIVLKDPAFIWVSSANFLGSSTTASLIFYRQRQQRNLPIFDKNLKTPEELPL